MSGGRKLILIVSSLVLLFLAATFVVSGMQGRSSEAEATLDAHARNRIAEPRGTLSAAVRMVS